MHDVVVIGGGPAGSTAATLLARAGHRVVLLEREKFPRFQIGESLLPMNNDLFERLGVIDRFETFEAVPKLGAEFVTGDGSVRNLFRFGRHLEARYARAFQVRRSAFDEVLLRNAGESGVEIHEETTVRDVDLSDPNRAVISAASNGTDQHFEARFVVDASGAGSVIGSRHGRRREEPRLRKVAFFAHYRGVRPSATDDNAGNIVIVVLRDAWVWMIPITSEITSIGVVVDRDRFVASRLTPEAILEHTLDTPYIRGRMEGSTRETPVHARRDFSFRMSRICGPNFALIGDAAGFFDPIFSTGVYIAMTTGEMAAEAIDERLRTGSVRGLDRYQRRLSGALERYFGFITRFYRREFLEVFMQPSERFGLLPVVVRVLAGDVFEEGWLQRAKLALFFALTALQARKPVIARPIAWDQLPSAVTTSQELPGGLSFV